MLQNPMAWLLSAVPGRQKVGSRPLKAKGAGKPALISAGARAVEPAAAAHTIGDEKTTREVLEMDYASCVCLDCLSAAEKERLEFELRSSAKVQRALLPQRASDFAGLDMAAFSRPATVVGGDLFDFYRFRDGSYGLLIADVAGHGLAASLIMASLQAALTLLVADHDTPDAVVRRLSRLFYENISMTSFVSLFLGHFDPLTKVLTYTNAGHNPPLVYRKQREDGQDKRPMWLHPTGAAVGLTAGQEFTTKSISLAAGDLLLLYTDGVTESMNSQETELGPGGLLKIVQEEPGAGAVETVQRLRSRLLEFVEGRPFADDVTIVACRILPG